MPDKSMGWFHEGDIHHFFSLVESLYATTSKEVAKVLLQELLASSAFSVWQTPSKKTKDSSGVPYAQTILLCL